MSNGVTRRQVLATGAALAAGTLSAQLGHGESVDPSRSRTDHDQTAKNSNEKFSGYSRYRPSFGGLRTPMNIWENLFRDCENPVSNPSHSILQTWKNFPGKW